MLQLVAQRRRCAARSWEAKCLAIASASSYETHPLRPEPRYTKHLQKMRTLEGGSRLRARERRKSTSKVRGSRLADAAQAREAPCAEAATQYSCTRMTARHEDFRGFTDSERRGRREAKSCIRPSPAMRAVSANRPMQHITRTNRRVYSMAGGSRRAQRRGPREESRAISDMSRARPAIELHSWHCKA